MRRRTGRDAEAFVALLAVQEGCAVVVFIGVLPGA